MGGSKRQHGLQRGDYPDGVIFEEDDGLYWLNKGDACLTGCIADEAYRGARVGFDELEASAHALSFMKLGVRVGVRRGRSIRMLSSRPVKKAEAVVSTPIFLVPELLLDPRELAQLRKGLVSKSCKYRTSFEHWQAALAKEVLTPNDWPSIYVYDLPGGMYEIDWQMTTLSQSNFEGLALASHLLGRKLTCWLIAPQRKGAKKGSKSDEGDSTLVTYGQMRLAL